VKFVRALLFTAFAAATLAAACAAPHTTRQTPPNVAPKLLTDPEPTPLSHGSPPPLFREVVGIDFDTTVRVAIADAVEVQRARLQVERAAGRYEGTVGALVPGLSPNALFEQVDGSVRGIDGPLLTGDFHSVAVGVLLRWVLDPGRAIHEVVAARRQVEVAEHTERHARQTVLCESARAFFELACRRERYLAARHALRTEEERSRLINSRAQVGLATPADRLNASGELMRRKAEEINSLAALYESSIALASNLRLDPAVTLVPTQGSVRRLDLVDDNLSIEDLLAISLTWREDLQSARARLGIAKSDWNAASWAAFGPKFDLGVQQGAIRSGTTERSFSWQEQRRFTAGAGWNLSLAAAGLLKVARASEREAFLDLVASLERVRAEVVRARQACTSAAQLLPLSQQRAAAAEETLRATSVGVRLGTQLEADRLAALQSFERARVEALEAVAQYNMAQIELLAALGLLDEFTLIRDRAEAHHSDFLQNGETGRLDERDPLAH